MSSLFAHFSFEASFHNTRMRTNKMDDSMSYEKCSLRADTEENVSSA